MIFSHKYFDMLRHYSYIEYKKQQQQQQQQMCNTEP